MRARDTYARAAAIQDELHDRLGPSGRFELAMRMSELAREFAKASAPFLTTHAATGTSRVTTLPAPMTAREPICTPEA